MSETLVKDVIREQYVTRKVILITSEQMGVDCDQINRLTHFVNDLNADSLDSVELVMEFEDEFEISVPDEEAEKCLTVGHAVDYILAHSSVQIPQLVPGRPYTKQNWMIQSRSKPTTADVGDTDLNGDVTQGIPRYEVHHVVVGCKVYHAAWHESERRLEIFERPDLCIYGGSFNELVQRAVREIPKLY